MASSGTQSNEVKLFIHSKSQDFLFPEERNVQKSAIDKKSVRTDSSRISGQQGHILPADLGCGEEEEEREEAVEEEVNRQTTEGVCKRCSLQLLEYNINEDDDNEEQKPEDEDSTDGKGMARIRKVVRECTCRIKSTIRRRIGDEVLVPTLVMRKYREENSRRKDITDCHQAQATTDLCISDPLEGDTGRGSVMLGAISITLKDEEGRLRHFIEQIQPNSAAHEMELEVEDELLLLNDTLLVDISAEQLKQAFSDVNVNEEFTLFTRRVKRTSGGVFSNDVEYEYWQVRVVLKVDIEGGMIVPEVTSHTMARNGDMVVIGSANVTPIHIETCDGYFKNVQGSLKIYPELVASDPALLFEKLTYNVFIIGGDSTKVVIFRCSSDNSTYFVYVNSGGNVKLRECPRNLNTTPDGEEVIDFSGHGFSIDNTIFYQHRVSKSKNRKFLQSYVKPFNYLRLDRNNYSLCLLEEQDQYMLNDRDDVKFDLHEA